MTARSYNSMTKAALIAELETRDAMITEQVQQPAEIAVSRFETEVQQSKNGFMRFAREVAGQSLRAVPENIGFLTRGAYIRVPEGVEVQRGQKVIVRVTLESVSNSEHSDIS